MIIIDTNLLIYAISADLPMHKPTKEWLELQMSSVEIGLPWLALVAFLRITTNQRVFQHPLEVSQALQHIDDWLALPNVMIVDPTENHWNVLSRLLLRAGTAGNLTNDAHLAAIAIEHGALLCSADNDFKRFQGVQHFNPLDENQIKEPLVAYR